MMVAKGERRKLRYQWFQVVRHLARRGDTRQQHSMMVLEILQCQTLFRLVEQRVQSAILYGRKEQLLIGKKVHCLGYHTIPHGFELLRALGNNDDVCTVLSRQRLTQSAHRQQSVVDNQPMVVDQQDIDARFDITMLKSIVQQDDVNILVVFHQCVYSVTAVLVHSHCDIREFLLHLERFITYLRHGGFGGRLYEALTLALIASAQHGGAEVILQQTDKVLHMRSLATATNCDIANRDDGYIKAAASQYSHTKKHVTAVYRQTVQPA